jgi:hypothetical protein
MQAAKLGSILQKDVGVQRILKGKDRSVNVNSRDGGKPKNESTPIFRGSPKQIGEWREEASSPRHPDGKLIRPPVALLVVSAKQVIHDADVAVARMIQARQPESRLQ